MLRVGLFDIVNKNGGHALTSAGTIWRTSTPGFGCVERADLAPREIARSRRQSGTSQVLAVLDFAERQWQERAEFLGRQPGFRSLRLHRALNRDSRFQLVNVAEWDSAEALQAATAQHFFQQSAQRSVQELAVAAHPAVYRVVIEATSD